MHRHTRLDWLATVLILSHQLLFIFGFSFCYLFFFQLEIECTWMRETNIDWIFQGPACAVLLINLIFLFRIMWVSHWAIEYFYFTVPVIKSVFIEKKKSKWVFYGRKAFELRGQCWRKNAMKSSFCNKITKKKIIKTNIFM